MPRPLAAVATLGLVVVGMLVALILVDWDALKGPIERRVSARTGHRLTIGGELRVAIARRLWITAEDVRLAAAAGANAPERFVAKRMTAALSWPALLIGRLDLHELELVQPRLTLERRAGPEAEPASGNLLDGRLRIRRLRVDEARSTSPMRRADGDQAACPRREPRPTISSSRQGTYRGKHRSPPPRSGPTVPTLAQGDDPTRSSPRCARARPRRGCGERSPD
jgi:hypothetical protein